MKAMDPRKLIRKHALALGYDLVGFSSLKLEPGDRQHLKEFARRGFSGEMHWFEKQIDFRLDPAKLQPGASGAIVLGLYYRDQKGEAALAKAKVRIARYAHGKDYHRVLRNKGKRLLSVLQAEIPGLEGRIGVDSAPIPEKILGRMAGLGWQGKNTNLIHPQLGSYFFLSVLLVNLDFPPADTITDQCKNCRLCVDACPTGALNPDAPYRLDARQCLSYLTIEHKGEIAPRLRESFSGWAFGCDICQEVCPYNRNRQARRQSSGEERFRLDARVARLMSSGEFPDQPGWPQWSAGSPLRRISEKKMNANLASARATRNKSKL